MTGYIEVKLAHKLENQAKLFAYRPAVSNRSLNLTELAWAAGLFEGEGCFNVRLGSRRHLFYPQALLKMTDEDVVRKFHRIVGMGSVYFKGVPKGGLKPQWCWRIGTFEHVQALAVIFWAHLGFRRKAKIKAMLLAYQSDTQGRIRRRKIPKN